MKVGKILILSTAESRPRRRCGFGQDLPKVLGILHAAVEHSPGRLGVAEDRRERLTELAREDPGDELQPSYENSLLKVRIDARSAVLSAIMRPQSEEMMQSKAAPITSGAARTVTVKEVA